MQTDGAPIRVLIVDDEIEYRTTLAKILRRRGMEVSVAAGGEEALACLAEAEPDAVILDLKMPGIDGLATLKGIAAAHPAVRVIMLTGHATLGAALDAVRHQVFDFLLKPVPTDHLVVVIEAAAAEKRAP